MKKKNIILWTLLLVLPLGASAQENIHFVAGTPTQKELSKKNKDALKLKVEQIIARNNAGAVSEYSAFVIQPELVLGESKKTEGLLRDVTLVTGEFSLTARNKYDDSVYGTTVIEVQGDAAGSTDEAIASLISSIKVTDPAFVRFIRTTRKRIAEFYVGREMPQEKPVSPEPEVDEPVASEPVVSAPEPMAPEPVIPEPMLDSEPVINQPEAPSLPECKISVSCNDLLFELVSCQGNETGGSIRIYARFTNTGVTNNSATIRMTSAIDPNGATFTNFSQVEANGCTPWTYGNKMPKGIKVGKVFEIKGVNSPCAVLSYVEITVDNCKVIIHNLPVEWR